MDPPSLRALSYSALGSVSSQLTAHSRQLTMVVELSHCFSHPNHNPQQPTQRVSAKSVPNSADPLASAALGRSISLCLV